jgi:hypothetical protein
MKKLFFFLIILGLLFVISSIFKGDHYIRLISDKTGVKLTALADIAESLSLENFMSEKRVEKQSSGKKRTGN